MKSNEFDFHRDETIKKFQYAQQEYLKHDTMLDVLAVKLQ